MVVDCKLMLSLLQCIFQNFLFITVCLKTFGSETVSFKITLQLYRINENKHV